MATTPRTKDSMIVYQSSLKNAVEYLKLIDKKATVAELFSLTYMMSEYCLNDTKGDEHFKTMVQKMDEALAVKK